MNRYRLTLALLLLCTITYAQNDAGIGNTKKDVSLTSANFIATGNLKGSNISLSSHEHINALKPYAPPSAGGGSGVLFVGLCSTYELGVTTVDLKDNNIASKASGFAYQINLGMDMHYGIISDKRISCFSLALGFSHFAANGKYSDTSGISHDNKFKIGYVGIPLTYTGILGADRTVGFYYQLGICPQYQVSAKNGDAKFTGLRKLITIPSLSIGLAIPQEAGRGGLNKIRMIGPYVSTSMSDLSSDDHLDFRCLTFGIRYYSMVLE